MKEPQLHTLVASRLCHDIIGPIGAVSNGIELVEAMGPAASEEDVALVSESAAFARQRIEMFRLAFGRATHRSSMTGEGFASVVVPALVTDRIVVDMQGTEFSGQKVSLQSIALAMMCAQKSLPKGGLLSLVSTANGFEVQAAGIPCVLPSRLEQLMMDGDSHAEEPNEVEYELLRRTTEETGVALGLERTENKLVLILKSA